MASPPNMVMDQNVTSTTRWPRLCRYYTAVVIGTTCFMIIVWIAAFVQSSNRWLIRGYLSVLADAEAMAMLIQLAAFLCGLGIHVGLHQPDFKVPASFEIAWMTAFFTLVASFLLMPGLME